MFKLCGIIDSSVSSYSLRENNQNLKEVAKEILDYLEGIYLLNINFHMPDRFAKIEKNWAT